MVLAAALISLAVLAPQAPAQAAPQPASQAKPQAEGQPAPTDGSKPYTVEGVRRASTGGVQPEIGNSWAEPARRGYGIAIDSRAVGPDPCSLIITSCRPAYRGGANPTWHDQFVALVGPQDFMVPYTAMTNSQTLQAVASSAVFALAFRVIASVIHDEVVKSRYNRKQRKIENVRAEIRAELDELERLNAAARASGQVAVK